jgi:hypothetical protein
MREHAAIANCVVLRTAQKNGKREGKVRIGKKRAII